MTTLLESPYDSTVQQLTYIEGYQPDTPISELKLDEITKRLTTAKQPVLLVDGGCIAGESPALLHELISRCNLPVVATLMGISAFPSAHPLHLGMLGMHGTVAANRAIQAADVIICLGVRFSDRVSGNHKAFSPNSFKIQIDIDNTELNKNIGIDIALQGSVEHALLGILDRIPELDRSAWHKKINTWAKHAPAFKPADDGQLTPQEVIRCIDNATNSDAIISTDVGQHQIWTAHHYQFGTPRSFLTSGGDGSFQMNIQEIMTTVDLGLNVKVAILKNGYLGMVRQWQQLFLNNRYSAVRISSPDFAALAKTFGAHGLSARTPDEAQAIIEIALSINGPVIMEFEVTEEANVYPIVPPGASNEEMIEE